MKEAIFGIYPRKGVKLFLNWLPGHARYWVPLGVVTDGSDDTVTVQVYGVCECWYSIAAEEK